MEGNKDKIKKNRETLKEYVIRYNAYLTYKNFSRIVYERNNQKIEENELIIKLKEILINAVEEVDNPPAIDIFPSDEKLYRARIVKDVFNSEDKGINLSNPSFITGFNKYESKEPALGVSQHGRNNYNGSSYLYLSDDKYTACAEVRPEPFSFISLASFRINKGLRIIDFSQNYSYDNKGCQYSVDYLMQLISIMFSKRITDDNDYYATQYISDLIRKYGFDGVRYHSSIADGNNYTIFNCNDTNISFESSEVIMVDSLDYNFFSFNSFEKYDKKHESYEQVVQRLKNERSSILKQYKIEKHRCRKNDGV